MCARVCREIRKLRSCRRPLNKEEEEEEEEEEEGGGGGDARARARARARAHARTRATSAFSSDRRSRALLRETRKGLARVS